MIETAVRDRRGGIDAVTGFHRRDKYIGAPELQIDTRLALLRGAYHLGAKHRLEPVRHRLGIGRAQMNVVPSEFGICQIAHGAFSRFNVAKLGHVREGYHRLFRKTGAGMNYPRDPNAVAEASPVEYE